VGDDGRVVVLGAVLPWVSDDGTTVWTTTADPAVVRHGRVDALPALDDVALPPGSTPVGAAGDGLLLSAAGGVYAWHPDDAPVRLATGDLLATGGSHLVVRECDPQLACSVVERDASTGAVQARAPVPAAAGAAGGAGGQGAVSADGSWWGLLTWARDQVVLTAQSAGGTIEVATTANAGRSTTPPVWSPDGRFLVAGQGTDLLWIDTVTGKGSTRSLTPLAPVGPLVVRQRG
jgi:hypothetical protein